MAQHDYIISDQSFPALRADLNNALAAIATGNSGNAAPSVTYSYMVWNDTLNGLTKIRNASDTAWIVVGALGAANLGLASLSGATFTGPVQLPPGSTVAGYLPLAAAGYRNLLINGNPTINQRGYVSGTATTSANQFTLDRWFVVISGQSANWSDSLGIRTVTAPAGGMAQVIEGANIVGTGTYCLGWVGTATATVNSTAVANGGSFTLTGGANVTVRFSNGTWSLAQLEIGSTPTPFEKRLGELRLCQPYGCLVLCAAINGAANTNGLSPVYFPTPMRASPTVINLAVGTVSAPGTSIVGDFVNDRHGGYFQIFSTSAGAAVLARLNFYSAELTS